MAGPLVRAGDVRDPLDVAIAEVGIVVVLALGVSILGDVGAVCVDNRVILD